VDKLYETTVEDFVAQHPVAEQGYLIAVELRHGLRIQLAADGIEKSVGDQGKKGVEAFAGSSDNL
jgi:hypothetical protein